MRNADAVFPIPPPNKNWQALLANLFASFFGMAELKRIYASLPETADSPRRFLRSFLEHLHVQWHARPEELERVPKTGPLVVVTNHPFGTLEGMILSDLLVGIRPDFRLIVHYLVALIPDWREYLLPVHSIHEPWGAKGNLPAMKKAMAWVKQGGALVLFPAGDVAHYQFSQGRVTDPVWRESYGNLIRRLNAPVLPIYFPGHNSLIYQMATAINKKLGVLFLLRELLNKQGKNYSVRIGKPIPFEKLQSLPGHQACSDYLRQRTFLLSTNVGNSEEPRMGIEARG